MSGEADTKKWGVHPGAGKARPTFHLTLSKILCKWKQDSVISSFLYLDSVFKNKDTVQNFV